MKCELKLIYGVCVCVCVFRCTVIVRIDCLHWRMAKSALIVSLVKLHWLIERRVQLTEPGGYRCHTYVAIDENMAALLVYDMVCDSVYMWSNKSMSHRIYAD